MTEEGVLISPRRDLPSLIRINGKGVQGSSDNEKVVAAYNMLLEATNYNEVLLGWPPS